MGRNQRIDSSGYVYHWIRAHPYKKGDKHKNYEVAYQKLLEILIDGFLKPGHENLTAGEKSICFTESPEYFSEWDQSRYQPFGFKFVKNKIYEQGGRPVFYGSYSDFYALPDSLKWRFAPHLPTKITTDWPYGFDYTWEREWRLRCSELDLLSAIAIIVPDNTYASRLETDIYEITKVNAVCYWLGSADARDDEEYREYFSSIFERIEFPRKFDEMI
ncbi:hypothetical protein AB3X26_11015 [Raoultella planticola]|uniref:hypothetical protein n=1 Tax=Raoultella planticola TaxID=575 RepID=UPI00349F9ACF